MIRVTIDGKEIEVPEGTTVLRAAEMAGIDIPTLCDHPKLTPYGGCRLCLVEVEGARTLQTSCTLPATNGMVVRTRTPQIDEARKFILTLLFSERNHFCMYCQMSGGDCELQNAAYEQDMTHWPLQPNWRPYPVDASHEDFVLDHNRCILCRRCVRACGELVGNFTLGVRERGANSVIVADLDVPLGESTCVSCGTCVQVCPTGAFIDRLSAYRGRQADAQKVKSICVGCSIGCGIELVVRDNQLLRIDGDWDAPVNEGLLCQIGRFKPMKETRERILTPLVKKNGALKAATWDEALDVVAQKLRSMGGSDRLTAIASPRLSAEALYLFRQIFAGELNASLATTEEVNTAAVSAQAGAELGGAFEGSLDALKSADCVVVLGADLIADHQVAGFFVKRALPRGTRLVVIDSEANPLAELANYTMQHQKGTLSALLRGIAAAVVQAGAAKNGGAGQVDLSDYDPEAVSQTSGVAADVMRTVARLLSTSQSPVFVYGEGVAQNEGSKAIRALVDLAQLIGASENGRSGIIGLKGQANSVAAQAYGIANGAGRLSGQQAAYLALGDEEVSQRLIQKLEVVPFLVVQASYVSPLTARADVVLPVAIWAEQSGHYVNTEGKIQESHAGLTPPEGVWTDQQVLQALADRLGVKAEGSWDVALQSVQGVAVK